MTGYGEEAGPFSNETIRHFMSELVEQKEKKQRQIAEEKASVLFFK